MPKIAFAYEKHSLFWEKTMKITRIHLATLYLNLATWEWNQNTVGNTP